MNGRERLERFLLTDPRDVGCDEAIRVLDVYVDLVLSGQDAEALHPGVAAHLTACEPCAEDFAGLLAAALARSTGVGSRNA